MAGIDLFISNYLSTEIKNNLESSILKKLEHQLFFEEGMSIKLSIEHFEKFHKYLKNLINFDLVKFERDCIEKIIKFKKNKNNYYFKIINPILSDNIFNHYGDPESRTLLLSIMGSRETIPKILKKSGISKSPAYRKIENLLIDGLIFESGKIIKNTKRISTYSCIFDEMNISIKNDEISIEGIISKKNFENSSITKTGIF